MASNNTTLTGTDLLSQPITVIGPQGPVEIPISIIDQMDISAICSVINYGSQIGACFIMLVVLLAMTPRTRLRRVPSIISVLALALNLIRVLLICLFYISDWNRFYPRVTGDIEFVARKWWNLSVVATVLSIPITVLIELSLIIQAWSMLQLWPTVQKWIALGLSVVLVLLTVAFSFFNPIMQALWILYHNNDYLYAKAVYVGLFTASISWFCFLFIIRLLTHMYTNRSILPSLKGLKAMDVLIMTNGILMLIPVVFSALQWLSATNFESASLTQTSVIVVLPLGTLVAQRLASPAMFQAAPHSSTGSSSAPGTSSTKRPLLTSETSAYGRGTSNNSHNNVGLGVSAQAMAIETKPHADHIDSELARIDDGDLEQGVRVDRRFEYSEERRYPSFSGASGRSS